MTEELRCLALAEWPGEAQARVVSVTDSGNRAEVALLVSGYDYWEYFMRDAAGRWSGTVSGNAPCDGWDDASVIDWGSLGREG